MRNHRMGFGLIVVLLAVIQWARIAHNADAHAYAKEYCQGSYEIVELGMIEENTKVIRFTCEEK